jgi:hypothetical protein
MSGRLWGIAVVIVALCGYARAQAPHAVVTALTGGGATRGPTGSPFPAGEWDDYIRDYMLETGESIVTAEDGKAVLMLADYETVVQIGDGTGRTHLALEALSAAPDGLIPLAPTLTAGRAYVVRKSDDPRWLVMPCRTATEEGYVLSRGASFVVEVTRREVVLAVTSGEILFFKGPLPAELLNEQGEPAAPDGMVARAGYRLLPLRGPTPVTDTDMIPAARNRMSGTLFAFGLDKGAQWVERAEQGDITPARGASRGAQRLFAGEVGVPRTTFDQPRSQIVVTSPRASSAPLRTVVATLPVVQTTARTLIESRVPTSVVVGSRLRRSRIVGNPGTSGRIAVNPQLEELIRLPGR